MHHMPPTRVRALYACVGHLLCVGVEPDICRTFGPESFDSWNAGVLLQFRNDHATHIPAKVGTHFGWGPWTVDNLLTAYMQQLMLEHPDAAPRSHFIGGYYGVCLGTHIPDDARMKMANHIETIVAMTTSDEVADRMPNRGRAFLAAYDRALAKVAAWEERFQAATDIGATVMRISAYRVRVPAPENDPEAVDQLEHHVMKGKARQTCQAVATRGREAQLAEVEVEAEPRDILVAALDGDLDELVTERLLETYVPTHPLKLAPDSWGYDVVEHTDDE